MSVVNCQFKYIRPTYNNLEELITNNYNYHIGRS